MGAAVQVDAGFREKKRVESIIQSVGNIEIPAGLDCGRGQAKGPYRAARAIQESCQGAYPSKEATPRDFMAVNNSRFIFCTAFHL